MGNCTGKEEDNKENVKSNSNLNGMFPELRSASERLSFIAVCREEPSLRSSQGFSRTGRGRCAIYDCIIDSNLW